MEHKAFTHSSNAGLLPVIMTKVGVFPVSPDPVDQSKIVTLSGVWDTGATQTAISNEAAQRLGLPIVSYTQVSTANGVVDKVPVYLVNVLLPNNVIIPNVQTTGATLNGCDMLIGMDIITTGDFAITNHNGKTVCSFRVPSHAKIDFIPEADKYNRKLQLAAVKRARSVNKPAKKVHKKRKK